MVSSGRWAHKSAPSGRRGRSPVDEGLEAEIQEAYLVEGMRSRANLGRAGLLGACWWLAAGAAEAQTWSGSETVPLLRELVTVDATGEQFEFLEKEDIFGDGSVFLTAESQLDARSAYVVTDESTLSVRVTVASETPPAETMQAYLFIDADQRSTTGGSAAAETIEAAFTSDPSGGGYEFVLMIPADGELPQLWAWSPTESSFELVPEVNAANAESATGAATDPVVGLRSGYLQARVDLDLVGLTPACNAELFFRSVSGDAELPGEGDLVIGEAAPCHAHDSDGDGVPDAADPPECTRDGDCPAGGLCVDGECVIAVDCRADGDCPGDEECERGTCIPRPAGRCEDPTDCGDLVCDDGTCVACTTSPQCGDGRTCAPGGRCVEHAPGSGGRDSGGTGGAGARRSDAESGGEPGLGLPLRPGDEVRGGAFKCSASGRHVPGAVGLPFLLWAGGVVARRRARRQLR